MQYLFKFNRLIAKLIFMQHIFILVNLLSEILYDIALNINRDCGYYIYYYWEQSMLQLSLI